MAACLDFVQELKLGREPSSDPCFGTCLCEHIRVTTTLCLRISVLLTANALVRDIVALEVNEVAR